MLACARRLRRGVDRSHPFLNLSALPALPSASRAMNHPHNLVFVCGNLGRQRVQEISRSITGPFSIVLGTGGCRYGCTVATKDLDLDAAVLAEQSERHVNTRFFLFVRATLAGAKFATLSVNPNEPCSFTIFATRHRAATTQRTVQSPKRTNEAICLAFGAPCRRLLGHSTRF